MIYIPLRYPLQLYSLEMQAHMLKDQMVIENALDLKEKSLQRLLSAKVFSVHWKCKHVNFIFTGNATRMFHVYRNSHHVCFIFNRNTNTSYFMFVHSGERRDSYVHKSCEKSIEKRTAALCCHAPRRKENVDSRPERVRNAQYMKHKYNTSILTASCMPNQLPA